MGTPRTLVAPGVRTPPRPGWRSGVGAAFAVALGDPALWLLGAVGFAARGGILFLALVIVVLPTPVEVRQLLGDYLASSGLTPAFFSLLLPVSVVATIVLAGSLLLVARVELAAWDRFRADPEGLSDAGEAPEPPPAGVSGRPVNRRRLLAELFAVQVLAAVALGAAALPLALSLYGATMDELLRPTPGGVALYLRVLYAVREPLLLLLPAVVLIDIFSAAAARRLMIRRPDGPRRGWRRALGGAVSLLGAPFRQPLGTLGTAAVAWLTTLGVLAPVVWALDAAWDATRAAYLGQRATLDAPQIAWLVIVSLVFAGIWAAAVLLAGFASAVRAGLWSAQALRAEDE